MGQPKPSLRFGEETLIERTVSRLRRAFDDIVVVSAPEAEAVAMPKLENVTIVRDDKPYAGPVGALARGLRAARHDIAFACSCDLPMLQAEVALWIVSMLNERPEYDAVIARIERRIQPLHAAYRRRCAAVLDEMLVRGENHLSAIVDFVKTEVVDEAEYHRHDPDALSCFNINTPADYARALKLAQDVVKVPR
jgi:molybdopterin-guanine dinucleotide biosynthesis protein A